MHRGWTQVDILTSVLSLPTYKAVKRIKYQCRNSLQTFTTLPSYSIVLLHERQGEMSSILCHLPYVYATLFDSAILLKDSFKL